jgi:hypothetical protein
MAHFLFQRVAIPRSTGGVRYECQDLITGEKKPWTIYIPQALVRDPTDPTGFAALITTDLIQGEWIEGENV